MIVFNPTNERLSFRILPPAVPDGVPNWRRKKLVRAGIVNVTINPKANYDLSQHGVTSRVGHPELCLLLDGNKLVEVKKPVSAAVAEAAEGLANEILDKMNAPSAVRDKFTVTKVPEEERSPLASTVPPPPDDETGDEEKAPAASDQQAFSDPTSADIAEIEDARGLVTSDEPEEGSEERTPVDVSGEGEEGQETAPVAPVEEEQSLVAPGFVEVKAGGVVVGVLETAPVAAEETGSALVCSACAFEAANPRGLKRHQASCKPFQAQQELAMDRGRVRIGDLDLVVEIARMPGDKQRGLQGHAPLSDKEGMLFVFPSPAWAEFHMGTVAFPIDVIFIRKGAVVAVEHGTPGRDDFWGHNNVSYVLEVRGGLCEENGIGEDVAFYLEGSQRTGNNQSKDLLRTLTEAEAEKSLAAHMQQEDIREASEQLRDPRKLACALRVAQLMDPRTQIGVEGDKPGEIRWLSPGPDLERARWKLAKRSGTRGFLRLLSMLEQGADDRALERTWKHVAGTLDFWERDAVVHGLVQAGFGQAIGFLRQAQTDSQLDIGWQHVPGAVSQTPPQDRYQGNQIPADTPGVGMDGPEPDQTIGYDPTHGDDLLGGTVGPMRPSASLDVGMRSALRHLTAGEIHPGDRVKVTDNADGLKRDDKGVAREVQNDMILVKFDGEPVERWVKDELMQQEQAKDEVLEEIDNPEGEGGEGGEGGPAGGGLGALLGI